MVMMKKKPIRALRELLGMSQREFADLVNIPLPSLRAIELGKYGVSDRVADKVCFATAISREWLQGSNPMNPTTNFGEPYTRDDYLRHKEKVQVLAGALPDSVRSAAIFLSSVGALSTAVLLGLKQGKAKEVLAEITVFINALLKKLGHRQEWIMPDAEAPTTKENRAGDDVLYYPDAKQAIDEFLSELKRIDPNLF
jgi:transcriptional regulator with XRE-family HTH domain